jgi:hypothetical protein
LIWETSSDGKSWNPYASLNAAFDVSSVRLYLGAGTEGVSPPNSSSAGFDDLNVIPP